MNKKIVIDYMNEVWNKKNLNVINQVFSDAAVIHSPLGEFSSPTEMRNTAEKWIRAIPDMNVTLLNIVEEKNLVIAHWSAKGTHQKEFNGIPPKGKTVDYQGMTMYRMDKGQIVEYWTYIDNWTLLKQMTGA